VIEVPAVSVNEGRPLNVTVVPVTAPGPAAGAIHPVPSFVARKYESPAVIDDSVNDSDEPAATVIVAGAENVK
jgi:hypothetical protein